MTLPSAEQPNGLRPAPRAAFVFLGAAMIVLQRIAVPVGGEQGMPAGPLLIAVVLLLLFATGRVQVDWRFLVGLLLFVAYGTCLALVWNSSITSVFLVSTIWFPIIFLCGYEAGRQFFHGILLSTLLACVLAVFQSALSAATGTLFDPIGATVPDQFLVAGFNSNYEVVWGSGWFKANGVFFLEPSMLSIFCALGILALLTHTVDMRAPMWLAMGALVIGLVSTVAISGLVILPALIAAIIRARRLLVTLCVSAIVVPLLLLLPQADAFFARSVATEGTSNDARLLRPYTILFPAVADSSPIIGFGPGSARRYVQATFTDWQSDVATPTLAKVAFEYGWIGLAILATATLALWIRSGLRWEMKLGLMIALLVPTDGLTSAVLAPAVILTLAAPLSNPSQVTTGPRLSGRPRLAADTRAMTAPAEQTQSRWQAPTAT